MVVGPAALRPVEEPVRFGDGQIVNAGVAAAHQPAGVELPVLVSIRAKPLARDVLRFVGEAHRNACVLEGPQLFDQPVFELVRPLTREKRDDLLAPVDELRTIAPAAVNRIGERDALRIARVPSVFGGAHFGDGALMCERRNDGACHYGRHSMLLRLGKCAAEDDSANRCFYDVPDRRSGSAKIDLWRPIPPAKYRVHMTSSCSARAPRGLCAPRLQGKAAGACCFWNTTPNRDEKFSSPAAAAATSPIFTARRRIFCPTIRTSPNPPWRPISRSTSSSSSSAIASRGMRRRLASSSATARRGRFWTCCCLSAKKAALSS